MLRAFAIVWLVMSIYAIVGTDFYGSVEPENFGSFVMTFYTLFEAMTFTWVEVARDLMESSEQRISVAMYYVSFMLVVSLVLVSPVKPCLHSTCTFSHTNLLRYKVLPEF